MGSVLIKYFCMFCLYLQPNKKQQQQQNNCKNVTFEHYFTYNFKIFLKLDSIYSVCVGGYLEILNYSRKIGYMPETQGECLQK